MCQAIIRDRATVSARRAHAARHCVQSNQQKKCRAAEGARWPLLSGDNNLHFGEFSSQMLRAMVIKIRVICLVLVAKGN